MLTKVCSRCKIEKPISGFFKNKAHRCGYGNQCKECMTRPEVIPRRRALAKKRYTNNKEQHEWIRRKSLLKTRYGLTTEGHDLMFENQKYVCAICGLPEKTIRNGKLLPLGVDHNHNTGGVRGLLCQSCNRAIGMLKVDRVGVQNLQMAIKYILETKNGK